MKWTNVIRLYQLLVVYLKLAFGGTRKGRSDYKKFTSNSVLIQCEGSAKAVSTKGKRTKIADFRVFFITTISLK